MREVKAIIRPERLNAVLQSLHQLEDLPGITISQVRGIGRSQAARAEGRTEYADVTMVKLETVIPESLVESVVDRIERSAQTGRPGDGKIFVIPVERARRIRSGEEGGAALW